MIRVDPAFARRLVDGATPHTARGQDLEDDLVDKVGSLEMVRSDLARFRWENSEIRVTVGADTRAFVATQGRVLWVADLPAVGEGCLRPFRPLGKADLLHPVPVRVPESVMSDLKREIPRFMVGDNPRGDLLDIATLRVGNDDLVVAGMRVVATSSTDDARHITLWLPGGTFVELRLQEEGGQGALVLVGVHSKVGDAVIGANTLLRRLPGATLALVPDVEERRVDSVHLTPFRPARSPVFESWARYARVLDEDARLRFEARKAHPLTFSDARQEENRWGVRVEVGADARDAWLGTEGLDRKARMDQPVELADADPESPGYVVETAILDDPRHLRLRLKPQRGAALLPERGVLRAVENVGSKATRDREKAALDFLGRGVMACPELGRILFNPEMAPPPEIRPLPHPVHDTLDAHQVAAVQLILGCAALVAIQGPPGTGKTRVIAEALRQIAAMCRGKKRPRVLVSSVQNEAVANVLERVAEAEGVVLRVLQRAAHNEDEAIAFARRDDEQRAAVIETLEESLRPFHFEQTLARLTQERSELATLQRSLAAGAEVPELDRMLAGYLSRAHHLLSSPLLNEAHGLLADLRRPVDPPVSTPSVPPPPVSADGVPTWWEGVRSCWPVETRAAVEEAVQTVARALAAVPLRRAALLDRAMPRFLTATNEPSSQLPDAPAPAETVPRLEAWVATALRQVMEVENRWKATPEAIAWFFLQDLKTWPQAWSRIVDRHANTVAATCSMSARARLDAGEVFDWVIIDEAGRATPFDLLVPMIQGVRVVLIGDQRQLPPTVDEALWRLADDGDTPMPPPAETLFGGLIRLLPVVCRTRLEVQYRMHGDIGALVDALFYRPHGESLESWFAGARAHERRSRLGVFRNAPLAWVEVDPGRARHREENEGEAARVLDLVHRYADAGAPDGHVAIICPYARQRERLRILLEGDPVAKRVAQVKTIDAVQGRDYPVVILSLVRTDGRCGFLASPNRCNVAISRAMQQLIVVGCKRRFLESPRVLEAAPHLVLNQAQIVEIT